MTLVTNLSESSEDQILSRYGDEIYTRYSKLKQETDNILSNNINDKLAININLNVQIVKDKKDAKLSFHIAKDGEYPATVLKEIKDINSTYPFHQQRVRELVEKNLAKKGITFKLTQNILNLICEKYNLKNDATYYYYHEISKRFGCTQKLIDFLTNLIAENQNIGIELLEEKRTKK